jgi:hypothetical protein
MFILILSYFILFYHSLSKYKCSSSSHQVQVKVQNPPSLFSPILQKKCSSFVPKIPESLIHFGPSVLRAPAEQTKVATILGN